MLESGALRYGRRIWASRPAWLSRYPLAFAIVALAVLSAAIWAVPFSLGHESRPTTPAGAGPEKSFYSFKSAVHAPAAASVAAPNYGVSDSTVNVTTVDLSQGRQISRQASLDLSVRSVRQAYADILELVRALSGYALQTDLTNSGADSGATLQVAVPASGLTGFLAAATRLGEVQDEGLSGNDVTSQVVDVQARLTVLNAEVSQLLTLMRRAGTVADMLQVEQQLVDTRTQIEELQAQRAALSQQVAMATVNITLAPMTPSLSPGGTSFATQIGQVFTAAMSALVYFVGRVLLAVVWLLPFAALAAAALAAWRTHRIRRGRRMQGP